MTFFSGLISSIFANNLVIAGYSLKANQQAGKRNPYRWVLFLLYFVEALLLSFAALGFRALKADHPIFNYLSILVFVILDALMTGIFYYLIRPLFKDEVKASLGEDYLSLLLNSSLLAIAISILSLAEDASFGLILGTMLGLPLGFLLSSYVFTAIEERLEANETKTYMRVPLLLLSLAGLALGLTMMSL